MIDFGSEIWKLLGSYAASFVHSPSFIGVVMLLGLTILLLSQFVDRRTAEDIVTGALKLIFIGPFLFVWWLIKRAFARVTV